MRRTGGFQTDFLDLQKNIYKKVLKAHWEPVERQMGIPNLSVAQLGPLVCTITLVDAHTLHLRPPETFILGTLLAPLGGSGALDGHPKPLRDPSGATCVHLVEKWCSLDIIWEKTMFHFKIHFDIKINKSQLKPRKVGVGKTSRKKKRFPPPPK